MKINLVPKTGKNLHLTSAATTPLWLQSHCLSMGHSNEVRAMPKLLQSYRLSKHISCIILSMNLH